MNWPEMLAEAEVIESRLVLTALKDKPVARIPKLFITFMKDVLTAKKTPLTFEP